MTRQDWDFFFLSLNVETRPRLFFSWVSMLRGDWDLFLMSLNVETRPRLLLIIEFPWKKFDTSSETRVTCWCVIVTNPIATLSPGIRVSVNTSKKCRWVQSILPRVPTCLRTTCLSSMSRNTVTRKKFCLPNPFFTLSCGCILWRQMGLLSLMLNWHQNTPTNHHKNYSKGSRRLRSFI